MLLRSFSKCAVFVCDEWEIEMEMFMQKNNNNNEKETRKMIWKIM